jgi:DNA polymerase III delta prime subunit
MVHHAYLVEAEMEQGIACAMAFLEKALGLSGKTNPDILVFRHELLSVEEVRRILLLATQAPLGKKGKAIIIATARLYHEAQNALLKLFEEPRPGTVLVLVVPSSGQLLATLHSRLFALPLPKARTIRAAPEAKAFALMSKEKRSAYSKKLATGKDEDERRENRDVALALVNGIEALAYAQGVVKYATFLRDISVLRTYLHDRSAPVRLILEHLSLVLPSKLV